MAGTGTWRLTGDVGALAEAVDREAEFVRFATQHQDRALRLALRLLSGDRAAAEDVVQDAFVRAHRGFGAFRGDARLSTWFDRILVREVYRHFRRPWRRWTGGSECPEGVSEAHASDGDRWLRGRIETSLALLSSNQRTVFVLVHLVAALAVLLFSLPGTLSPAPVEERSAFLAVAYYAEASGSQQSYLPGDDRTWADALDTPREAARASL